MTYASSALLFGRCGARVAYLKGSIVLSFRIDDFWENINICYTYALLLRDGEGGILSSCLSIACVCVLTIVSYDSQKIIAFEFRLPFSVYCRVSNIVFFILGIVRLSSSLYFSNCSVVFYRLRKCCLF